MRSIQGLLSLAFVAISGLTACGGGGSGGSGGVAQGGSPPAPSAICVDRAELCAEELLDSLAARLTDNRFYMAEPDAGAAIQEFKGTLTIPPTAMQASGPETSGRNMLPGFSVQFLTVGDYLVPLERDIIPGRAANRWDIILSPGKVWSEPGDLGMSRASFPFTLVTNQWNEAHNGVATFLYDNSTISGVRFQVAQETAVWNKVDLWGIATATYEPGVIADAERHEQDFLDELDGRVKTRKWSRLSVDFPDADLSDFTRNISSGDISGTALLIDDTLYYQDAASRRGEYPYPLEMRHGVFSVTKSAGAALTMLRLAEKYGEQVFDLFVTDYLDVTAAHDGWNGVTFGHLLNMAAGIGENFPDPNAAATFADENDDGSVIWFDVWNTYPKTEKLRNAFRYGDYPWAPGQIVRYNTAHTLILGAAMESFYKSMAGPDANVWQMMLDEVYRPIGIRVLPMIRTTDADPIPIYGFGLFLNAYDTARINQLLDRDGAYNGQQILHRERTRQSLYRTSDAGYETFVSVTTDRATQSARYLNSFWSFFLQGPAACTARIPYMWGFGGNFVVIMPNGISAYRFADGDVHDPAALALAASTIRPAC